jgi:hypothetical protein
MLQSNGQAPTRHGGTVEPNRVGMPARLENACCQVNGEAAKVAKKKSGNLFASRFGAVRRANARAIPTLRQIAIALLRHTAGPRVDLVVPP